MLGSASTLAILMMFGATAHMAWISMQVLKTMLPGKLISHLVGGHHLTHPHLNLEVPN
jgi:hypothetical protein